MPALPSSSHRRHLVILAVFLALVAAIVACLLVGHVLTRPALHPMPTPPSDLPIQEARIRTTDAQPLSGWWIPGRKSAGAVLLLHGIRSDRTQMLGRARFLHRLGYHTLLPDLPAHGESRGDHITFGAEESRGVAGALAYLATAAPDERIGVIGVSLGAASIVLLDQHPPLAAVVLESLYPTIAEAAADRLELHLGPAARGLAPLLLWQLPVRLGIPAARLRPIDALPSLRAPVLIASGTRDRHTPWAETEALYRAAAEPKQLWPVEGAIHQDLHAYSPRTYEAVVADFLAKHLRGEAVR